MLYASRYAGGGDLLELAAAADCPPVLLLRRLLEAAPLGVPRAVRLAAHLGPASWFGTRALQQTQRPQVCGQSERRGHPAQSCVVPAPGKRRPRLSGRPLRSAEGHGGVAAARAAAGARARGAPRARRAARCAGGRRARLGARQRGGGGCAAAGARARGRRARVPGGPRLLAARGCRAARLGCSPHACRYHLSVRSCLRCSQRARRCPLPV